MITRHILTLETGRRVHYRRCGEGPALLMIHQSPRSSAEYVELMERWGERFTCIAPDTPGFGQSDPLPGESEIGKFADALAAFAAAIGLKRCAAYGFHSGGIIAVTALKRHPALFSCLAVGGYAIWTADEIALFGDRYLPPLRPSPYGEHLIWLWNRMLEQSWFFPWFDLRDEARLSVAHADTDKVHRAVMEMLDAGDAYRAGYGAVLRAPRDIPPPDAASPPVLITAYDGDSLQSHIERLGAMPAGWEAHKVATPAAQHEASLAFLCAHAAAEPAPFPVEDAEEGWIPIGGGLIHWRGERGETLSLHRPAAELDDAGGRLAIDAPGHGLSDAFDDPMAAIAGAAGALGAPLIRWPGPPPGDPERLYPDLAPQRFGEHLTRAWGAARAEALFAPWYAAERTRALRIDLDTLEPAAIARRTRARLRAGEAARAYHNLLQDRHGDPP